MSGEFRFTEDPVPPGPDQPRATRSGSWAPVVVVTVGSCLVAGAVMWVIVPKGGPDPAPQAAAAPVAEPTEQAQPARPAAKPEYDGPPKFTVQLGESKTGDCPAVFTESIVVRVYKGEAERIRAVAKVPVDKVTRSRELFEIDTEWTTMIGALPTKRTITVAVTAKGRGGETTVTEDISEPCPGEPVDKPDPTDLSTKSARKQIQKDMFDGNYDFEFDFEGTPGDKPGGKSGDTKD